MSVETTSSKMNEPHFICLDQGSHATKATLYDAQGNYLYFYESALAYSISDEEKVEYDADEYLYSVFDVLNEIVEFATRHHILVHSIGLATQRSSIVCWDKKTGQPLSPVISWQDTRASSWIEKFLSHQDDIHQRTGLYLSAHYGVSKIHWCIENVPSVAQALNQGRLCIAPVACYLIWKLTAEHNYFVDITNATRTLLVNRRKLDWDAELLNLFNIQRVILPACVNNVYSFGSVQVKQVSFPLRTVIGDQPASVFSRSIPSTETTYINVGSGAFVIRTNTNWDQETQSVRNIVDRLEFDPKLLNGVLFKDHRVCIEYLEGTINGAGNAIRWFEKKFKLSRFEKEITKWCETEQNPVLFLNSVSGLGSPYWSKEIEPQFVSSGSISQCAVGLIESIVFLLFTNVERMDQCLGQSEQIYISGGVSRIDPLCQKLADLSQKPVYRFPDAEATTQGLAHILSGFSKHWTPMGNADSFPPHKSTVLEHRYKQWRGVLESHLST